MFVDLGVLGFGWVGLDGLFWVFFGLFDLARFGVGVGLMVELVGLGGFWVWLLVLDLC